MTVIMCVTVGATVFRS